MKSLPNWVRFWKNAVSWLLGLCLLIAIPYILFAPTGDRIPATWVQAHLDTAYISNAIRVYQDEYGLTLTGDHAAIIHTLLGDNPRKLEFLAPRFAKNPKVRKGGLVDGVWYDPWGSPYRIDVSDPANPKVWSPGKNKKDEADDPHSDDICSWR